MDHRFRRYAAAIAKRTGKRRGQSRAALEWMEGHQVRSMLGAAGLVWAAFEDAACNSCEMDFGAAAYPIGAVFVALCVVGSSSSLGRSSTRSDGRVSRRSARL